jgi:hypothetical protein
VPRDALPGIVVIYDRSRLLATCAGFVLRSEPAADRFASYVVTAAHCVDDPDHPHRFAIATPVSGDSIGLWASKVLDATVISATPHGSSEFFPSSPVNWLDGDWAILRVETPFPLPTLPVFEGDPVEAIRAGDPVTIAAYHDVDFVSRDIVVLRAHEHPFQWTGLPSEVAQPGHSGAPILWRGKVIGMLSGLIWNTFGCRLVAGRYETALNIVSIRAILSGLKAQGLPSEPIARRARPSPLIATAR